MSENGSKGVLPARADRSDVSELVRVILPKEVIINKLTLLDEDDDYALDQSRNQWTRRRPDLFDPISPQLLESEAMYLVVFFLKTLSSKVGPNYRVKLHTQFIIILSRLLSMPRWT